MEEDIETLKRIWRKLPFEDSAGRNAISNLIARNKELEEENKKLKSMNGFGILDVFNMGKESSRQRIKYDWVEKEKIREKLKEEQERIKHGLGEFYNDNLGNSATRILQELLEES